MGYDIVDELGNVQGRKEIGDSLGNKKGSYSIALIDGRRRIVEYVADGNGFRAIVRSNEPGTDASQDPADVIAEELPGKRAVLTRVVKVLQPLPASPIVKLLAPPRRPIGRPIWQGVPWIPFPLRNHIW